MAAEIIIGVIWILLKIHEVSPQLSSFDCYLILRNNDEEEPVILLLLWNM